MYSDKDIVFKVLSKYLRLEAVQAILDDIAPTDPRARQYKPQELYDRRYLDEMVKSGFMDKLWDRTAMR